MGLHQAAMINTACAVATMQLPAVSRVFEANSAVARLAGHEATNTNFDIGTTTHNGVVYNVDEHDAVVLSHARLTHFKRKARQRISLNCLFYRRFRVIQGR